MGIKTVLIKHNVLGFHVLVADFELGKTLIQINNTTSLLSCVGLRNLTETINYVIMEKPGRPTILHG